MTRAPLGVAAAFFWALVASALVGVSVRAFEKHSRESDVTFVDHSDVPVVRFDAATESWTTLGAPPERPTAMVTLEGGGVLMLGLTKAWRTEDGEHFAQGGDLAGHLVDDAYALADGGALLRSAQLDRVWNPPDVLRSLEGEAPPGTVACVDGAGTVNLFYGVERRLLARPWLAWARAPDVGQTTRCGALGGRVVRFNDLEPSEAVGVLEADGGSTLLPGVNGRVLNGARQLPLASGLLVVGGESVGELLRASGDTVERFAFPSGTAPQLAALSDEVALAVGERAGPGQWDAWLIDGTRVKQLGLPVPFRRGALLAALGNGRAILAGGVWSETFANEAVGAQAFIGVGAALALLSLCFGVLRRARGWALAVFLVVLGLGSIAAWFVAFASVGGFDIHIG